MGLPKRAAARLCANAYCAGLLAHESPGPISNWIRKKAKPGHDYLFYRDFIFVFAKDSPTCVTVIDMSSHLYLPKI